MESANCLMCGKEASFPRCEACEADFRNLAYNLSLFSKAKRRPDLQAVAYLINSYGVTGVCELFDLTKHDVWDRIREVRWSDLVEELLAFADALKEEERERYQQETTEYA